MAVASLTITTLSVTFSPSNAMQCISSSNAAPEGSEILQPISEREAKSQIEPLSVPSAVTLAFLITSFSVVPLYPQYHILSFLPLHCNRLWLNYFCWRK